MAESIMLNRAKDFAVEIINMCKDIKETKRESVLTNQLMRSGTSIGANIHESKYAHGTADFISKMQSLLMMRMKKQNNTLLNMIQSIQTPKVKWLRRKKLNL